MVWKCRVLAVDVPPLEGPSLGHFGFFLWKYQTRTFWLDLRFSSRTPLQLAAGKADLQSPSPAREERQNNCFRGTEGDAGEQCQLNSTWVRLCPPSITQ